MLSGAPLVSEPAFPASPTGGLCDAEGLPVGAELGDGDDVTDDVGDAVTDDNGDAELVGVAVVERVGVAVVELVGDADAVGLDDAVADGEGEADGRGMANSSLPTASSWPSAVKTIILSNAKVWNTPLLTPANSELEDTTEPSECIWK